MKHVVKAGETLSHIARNYDTTVEALVASNGIRDKNLIHVGQVLQIPTKEKPKTVEKALASCLDAIERLPEFKKLLSMLEE